jgi:hypothetical protein
MLSVTLTLAPSLAFNDNHNTINPRQDKTTHGWDYDTLNEINLNL